MPGTIASSLQSSGGGLFNTLQSMGVSGIGGKVAFGLGIALGTAAAIFTFMKKKKAPATEVDRVEDHISTPPDVVTEVVTKCEEPVLEAVQVKATESAPTQTQPNEAISIKTINDPSPVVVEQIIAKQVPVQETTVDQLADLLASQIQSKLSTPKPEVADLTPHVAIQQEKIKVEESVPINEPAAQAVNIPVVNNAREDVEEDEVATAITANKPSTFEQIVRAVQDEEYEEEEEEESTQASDVESDENDVHIIFPSEALRTADEKAFATEFSIDNLIEPVLASVKLADAETVAVEPVNTPCDIKEDQPNSSLLMSSIEVLETTEQVSEMMAAATPQNIPESANDPTPIVEYVAKVVTSESVAAPFAMEKESEQENSEEEEYESDEEEVRSVPTPRGAEIKDRLFSAVVPPTVVSAAAEPEKSGEFSWESDEQIESEIR